MSTKREDAQIIARAMSLLGQRTSAKKAAAARANGSKGGRPPKVRKDLEK